MSTKRRGKFTDAQEAAAALEHSQELAQDAIDEKLEFVLEHPQDTRAITELLERVVELLRALRSR